LHHQDIGQVKSAKQPSPGHHSPLPISSLVSLEPTDLTTCEHLPF